MAAEVTPNSRLPLVDIETMAGPEGDTLRAFPMRLNIVAMAAHARTSVLPQLNLGRAVMTEQVLAPLKRELLILLAARLDGSQYVWSQHRAIAEQLGASAAMVDAIETLDLTSAAFNEADQALLTFGAQVVRGGDVQDQVFETLSGYLSPQEIVEAIIAIGYYMTMNRLTVVTRTPLEPGAAQKAMRNPAPAAAE